MGIVTSARQQMLMYIGVQRDPDNVGYDNDEGSEDEFEPDEVVRMMIVAVNRK